MSNSKIIQTKKSFKFGKLTKHQEILLPPSKMIEICLFPNYNT